MSVSVSIYFRIVREYVPGEHAGIFKPTNLDPLILMWLYRNLTIVTSRYLDKVLQGELQKLEKAKNKTKYTHT